MASSKLSKPARKLIITILDLGGLTGTKRASTRKKLEKVAKERGGTASLKAVLAQAKAVSQGQTGVRQQKKAQAKAQGGTKRRKSSSRRKLPKSLKTRAGKISRAIAAGKIAAKQGKAKPGDYASGTTREKYDKFIALYKGVVVGRKGGKKKGPSITAVFKQITGRKYPYYLSPGYHVKAFNVGGGKRGGGIIRAVPKQGAPTFSGLSDAKKKTIVTFLNSAKGQALRSKGAPKKASLAQARAQGAANR